MDAGMGWCRGEKKLRACVCVCVCVTCVLKETGTTKVDSKQRCVCESRILNVCCSHLLHNNRE